MLDANRQTRPRAGGITLVGALLMLLAPGAGAAAFSPAALDTVLARHLHGGRVDYGGLAHDAGPLERFLAATRTAHPDAWPRDEQIAFWVNAYNARVLSGVIHHPGLKSVLDVGKTREKPKGYFFDQPATTAGRDLSLNDIEIKVLRKQFREPRIHFVLNCASISCAPLLPGALHATTLDATLEDATRSFLRDPTRNHIGPDGSFGLSRIFDWYRADFIAASGSLLAYVQRHWSGPEAKRTMVPIEFLPYDWSLNGRW